MPHAKARLDYLAGESQDETPEVQIEYYPEGASKVKYDVIRSIDRLPTYCPLTRLQTYLFFHQEQV